MKYDEEQIFECPICGREFKYVESMCGLLYDKNDECIAILSTDCHGIPFRTICCECYDKVMDEKGYDGEYYTELDECIDEYY